MSVPPRTPEAWVSYRDAELEAALPLLARLGFKLEDEQVHLGGERYLTAGRKLVLVARRQSDGLRLVVKVSSHPDGVAELERELRYRRVLERINFAYHVFMSPPVLLDGTFGSMRVVATEFIEQSSTFLSRPVEEQLFLALKAFEGLEGVHATTYGHRHDVQRTLGIWTAETYRREVAQHLRQLSGEGSLPLGQRLEATIGRLAADREVVDLYGSFLTHWDLVPHNLRVRGHDLYLLDHSALRFGSKHEGWARFTNFMALYNPALEAALVGYVAANRGQLEARSLRAMRLYRAIELAWYYWQTLPDARGDLQTLNQRRVELWLHVFDAVAEGRQPDPGYLAAYRAQRDALRDEAELRRQRNLH